MPFGLIGARRPLPAEVLMRRRMLAYMLQVDSASSIRISRLNLATGGERPGGRSVP
jgi:hypothetical protein